MTDTENDRLQENELNPKMSNPKSRDNNPEPPEQKCNPGKTADNLRVVSYFVLFIAGVFVVNAMETGSYRTPWPVAIIVSLAGLWLFGYSRRLQHRDRRKSTPDDTEKPTSP